jgi:LDH2 family malate/lactate/ureidoglycolate dehydrogenase
MQFSYNGSSDSIQPIDMNNTTTTTVTAGDLAHLIEETFLALGITSAVATGLADRKIDMNNKTTTTVKAGDLSQLIEEIFVALGAASADAADLADSLVGAELDGIPSHGVALLPMYVERVRLGSVSLSAKPAVVEDFGGLAIMSANNTLGQVSSQAAIELATSRAREHGVACVAVRDGFHFGTAAHWARKIADAGMIGFAFSNTRPLMPAPGGAERVVGNNPLAIAFPSGSGTPIVVDMAMSATAMGKIRLAEAAGRTLPPGWATDAEGKPTTSPTEAINGLLLPAAGPKGFGLAVAIDLLCGALAGGGFGAGVQALYGELDKPYNCAHCFIAIDAQRTGGGQGIGNQADALAQVIRSSRKAPGNEQIFAPGDLERARRAQHVEGFNLPSDLVVTLNRLAEQTGAPKRI